MSYSIVEPPLRLPFEENTKAELRAYFQWFQAVIPTRIEELTGAVNDSSGFEDWVPDRTPNSLGALGEWFAGNVEMQDRHAEDVTADGKRLPYWMEPSTKEFTILSLSFTADVAMYLSDVLLTNHPSLKWTLPLGSKKFIDYGRASLTGFTDIDFEPLRFTDVIARKMFDGTDDGMALRNAYERRARRVL